MKATSALVVTALFSLSACASTGGNLQLASATAINRGYTPKQITVSDVKRGATSVKWSAAAPDGSYTCGADDMMRRPYCAKR